VDEGIVIVRVHDLHKAAIFLDDHHHMIGARQQPGMSGRHVANGKQGDEE
jgi:hypothetical protein